MYVHGFDGAWLDHPFWRCRFVLSDDDAVAKVRSSRVTAMIIDDEKGLGIEPGPSDAHGAGEAAPASYSILPSVPAERRSRVPVALSEAEEIGRARKILSQSERVVTQMYKDARLGKALGYAQVSSIVDEITGSVLRNSAALISLARIKTKDRYTYLHSVAVCALMINLGRQSGIGGDQLHDLGVAGLLHDLGKASMPDEILNKPGALSDDEFAMMRLHPERGHLLLLSAEGAPGVALDVCLHHHERFDGSGYPGRLAGEGISLPARMGAICDVYDALTSNRAYKTAWTPVETVAKMMEWEGHFDPQLMFRFLQSIEIYPVGMLVRMRSNRLAVVLYRRRKDDDLRVRIFYSIADRRIIRPETITVAATLAGDQIMGHEHAEAWGFPNWAWLCDRILAGAGLAELSGPVPNLAPARPSRSEGVAL